MGSYTSGIFKKQTLLICSFLRGYYALVKRSETNSLPENTQLMQKNRQKEKFILYFNKERSICVYHHL